MSPATILSIMYGPYGYAHPDHRKVADVDLMQLPVNMANQLLIDHHGLTTGIDFDVNVDLATQQCLHHWARLPRICYLMGVQSMRTALVECSRYLHLDQVSQQFLCLPLRPTPSRVHADEPDDMAILAAGVSSIAAVLRCLPQPLQQRLPLLFPRDFATRLSGQLQGKRNSRAEWYPSLFSFAVNYALLDPATAA